MPKRMGGAQSFDGGLVPAQGRPMTPDDAEKPRHHLPGNQRPSMATLLLSDATQSCAGQATISTQPSQPSLVGSTSELDAAENGPQASVAFLEDVAVSAAWASANAVSRERCGQAIMSTSPHVTVGPDVPMVPCAGPGDPQDEEEEDQEEDDAGEVVVDEMDELFSPQSGKGALGTGMSPSDVFRESVREHPLGDLGSDGGSPSAVHAGTSNGNLGSSPAAGGRGENGLLGPGILRGSPLKSARRSTSVTDLDPLSRAARELYAVDPLQSTASSALLALEEPGAPLLPCPDNDVDARCLSRWCDTEVVHGPLRRHFFISCLFNSCFLFSPFFHEGAQILLVLVLVVVILTPLLHHSWI